MKPLRAILLGMTLGLVATAASASPAGESTVSHTGFGKLPDGSSVEIYTLKNAALEMRVMTFGARVVSLKTADRSGKMGDVVLGYNSLEPYVTGKNAYFGVVAGRYANRIAGGKFTLEGKTYHTPTNDGPNTLHGGTDGFDHRNWSGKEIPGGVEFTLNSPDGDQGFPGAVTAHVRYTLHGDTARIEYSATSDKPTVVNLTNHSYFNLAGDGMGDILGTQLTLDADKYTPVDATLIPTGELAPVAGTPFDFTKPEAIGARIGADNTQLKLGKGYDHNWVVRGTAGQLRPAAKAYEPKTGRVLSVQTTQPGVQFYSGNFLDGALTGRTGAKYTPRTGFCLETQHFPDSPNHPAFPSTELKPGQTFHSATTWTFTTQK